MPGKSREKRFKEIYNLYYPLLFNNIYRKIRAREESEDYCHEIFITLHNNLDSIDDMNKWMWGAIKNSVKSYYIKKGMRESNVAIDELHDGDTVACSDGDGDLRIIMNEAIAHEGNYENEKERVLFQLIAINKYTVENAARHLGMTRRQAEYAYGKVSQRILQYFHAKGMKSIEDVL
jgi:RNA polymerase sigma factor (sigma-70 family)